MSTKEIVAEIERLPMASRIRLIEEALRTIRTAQARSSLSKAATALHKDYVNDKSLTAFTSIDLDRFYEAR